MDLNWVLSQFRGPIVNLFSGSWPLTLCYFQKECPSCISIINLIYGHNPNIMHTAMVHVVWVLLVTHNTHSILLLIGADLNIFLPFYWRGFVFVFHCRYKIYRVDASGLLTARGLYIELRGYLYTFVTAHKSLPCYQLLVDDIGQNRWLTMPSSCEASMWILH